MKLIKSIRAAISSINSEYRTASNDFNAGMVSGGLWAGSGLLLIVLLLEDGERLLLTGDISRFVVGVGITAVSVALAVFLGWLLGALMLRQHRANAEQGMAAPAQEESDE